MTFYLNKLEKEDQTNSKTSRKNEIKIRVETENRKIEKINETRSWILKRLTKLTMQSLFYHSLISENILFQLSFAL